MKHKKIDQHLNHLQAAIIYLWVHFYHILNVGLAHKKYTICLILRFGILKFNKESNSLYYKYFVCDYSTKTIYHIHTYPSTNV